MPAYGQQRLADQLGVPVVAIPLDRELPADLPSEDQIEGAKSRYTL